VDGLRLLPWATTGADVVPGVARRVHELADELDDVGRGLTTMQGLVHGVSPLDWVGPASALCALVLRQQPERYRDARRAMAMAADALRAHADVLTAAQDRADRAIRMDVTAAILTRRWLAAVPPTEARVVGGPGDPGASLRIRVRAEVDAARRLVTASAVSTAQCLRAAAGSAPEQPRLASRTVHSLAGFGRDVRQGVTESVAQTLGLGVLLDPRRAGLDPIGYAEDLRALGGAAAHALTHPGQLVAAVADLDTLHDSRGRWVGRLLPDVALAVGSAGAVPIAERTSTLAARTAARIGPRSLRDPLREAIALQAGSGRGPLRLRDVRAYEGPPDPAGYRARLDPVDHAVAQRVARDAQWAQTHLTPAVQAVADDVARRVPSGRPDVGLQGLTHTLKDPHSLSRKLASDAARTGQSVPALAPGVNDTVRYTLTLPHEHYVAAAAGTVAGMRAHGFTLTTAKNFWGGERYQGLNLTFHDPATGRPFELQLHTPASWQATVDTHPDYEMLRSEGLDAAQKEFYARRIAARFSTVALPHHVGSLSHHLVPADDAARMTAPLLRTLPDVDLGVRLSTGVHTGVSLAWDDDR
jgi:hypothetical protein